MKKSESWRERYVRLLTDKNGPRKNNQDDLNAIEDLVEEKLIRAELLHGMELNVLNAAGTFAPTLKGRLFAEDQKAILRSRTFTGRLKANWTLLGGLFIALLGWGLGLLTPLFQEKLKERIHPNNQIQNEKCALKNMTQETRQQPNQTAHPAASFTAKPAQP